MDNLYKALAFTLKAEGGYSDDPNDPGGATNKGITQAVYDNYRIVNKLDKQSVRLISANEVYDIYENNYWNCLGCDKISDIKLAISVFDAAVNAGPARAARWLRLCNRDYKQFNQLRLNYYNNLVKVHAKLARYLKGWTNRVNSLNLYLTTIK